MYIIDLYFKDGVAFLDFTPLVFRGVILII